MMKKIAILATVLCLGTSLSAMDITAWERGHPTKNDVILVNNLHAALPQIYDMFGGKEVLMDRMSSLPIEHVLDGIADFVEVGNENLSSILADEHKKKILLDMIRGERYIDEDIQANAHEHSNDEYFPTLEVLPDDYDYHPFKEVDLGHDKGGSSQRIKPIISEQKDPHGKDKDKSVISEKSTKIKKIGRQGKPAPLSSEVVEDFMNYVSFKQEEGGYTYFGDDRDKDLIKKIALQDPSFLLHTGYTTSELVNTSGFIQMAYELLHGIDIRRQKDKAIASELMPAIKNIIKQSGKKILFEKISDDDLFSMIKLHPEVYYPYGEQTLLSILIDNPGITHNVLDNLHAEASEVSISPGDRHQARALNEDEQLIFDIAYPLIYKDIQDLKDEGQVIDPRKINENTLTKFVKLDEILPVLDIPMWIALENSLVVKTIIRELHQNMGSIEHKEPTYDIPLPPLLSSGTKAAQIQAALDAENNLLSDQINGYVQAGDVDEINEAKAALNNAALNNAQKVSAALTALFGVDGDTLVAGEFKVSDVNADPALQAVFLAKLQQLFPAAVVDND